MVTISTKKIIIFLLILIFIFAGLASYFYLHEKMHNQSSESQSHIDSIIKDVSKMILVPDNEKPTVAKVSDPDSLHSDIFFYDAQKDDYVLIYTLSKKAILYRSSIGKVINIAPVDNNVLQNDGSDPNSPEGFFPKSFPNSNTKVKVDNY